MKVPTAMTVLNRISKKVPSSFLPTASKQPVDPSKVTQPAVEDLIESIFRAKIEDGQLDKCPLTFKELQQIRSSFARTLLNMLHARIEYPKSNESSSNTTANPQPVESTQKASEIDDSTRTQQPI